MGRLDGKVAVITGAASGIGRGTALCLAREGCAVVAADLNSQCLCGAIRYSIDTEPITSGACHCRDCQYVSGGSPAYVMIFPKASFRLTKRTPRWYWSLSESGNRVARCFCESCGTPLFGENESTVAAGFVAVRVGGLDDPSVFKPGGHAWTSSAQPWHIIDPGLPRWEKNPY